MRWFGVEITADGFSFESAVRAPSRIKAEKKVRRRLRALKPEEADDYKIELTETPIASNWQRFRSRTNGFC